MDVLQISETKLDDTFPNNQFTMEGYKIIARLDRNQHGGGIIIYVKECVPSKIVGDIPFNPEEEGFFIELKLRNTKWLLFRGYNPKKEFIVKFINNLESALSKHMHNYDNIIVMGDLNCDMLNVIECNKLIHFSEVYSIKNLIQEPTCFKNPRHPTCLDLVLTNRKEYFQNKTIIETGLSDYHKMTVTCLKTYIKNTLQR